MPFQPGNTEGSKSRRAKPYADALRMASAELESGKAEECPYPKGSLRWIAWQQLIKAGDDTSAAKEIADRLDGKVAQPIAGDDELPPVQIGVIERLIVDPKAADSDG